VRRLLIDDAHHSEEWRLLWDNYEQLSNRAATALLGVARAEFHKQASSFRSLDLRACWTIDQVKRCLSDAHRLISAIDKLVSKAESIAARLPQVRQTYEQLDRAVIIGDANANAKYIKTTKLIEEIEAAASHGELERAAALLISAETSVSVLRLHVDREASNAAEELSMWLKVATLCPNALGAFKSELERMPLRPSGNDLQNWFSLRRRIETSVWKSAAERRAANGAVLKRAPLTYQFGQQNERQLPEFMKKSLLILKSAVNS
jgi:hypothetical protein